MGRTVQLFVATSSVVGVGILVWRARKGAQAAVEQAEKMVANGPMVRDLRVVFQAPTKH